METTRYELPHGGTTLLEYIVRRMHKTEWLIPVQEFLENNQAQKALARIATYTTAASTSFGPAYYQPQFNEAGEEVELEDPATGALINARIESRSPHFRISYSVKMPNNDRLVGEETIVGTKIGLKGLGMPAPSRFSYRTGDGEYTCSLAGILTSELSPAIFGPWRIRAHGNLTFSDNRNNKGSLTLKRNGELKLHVNERLVEKYSLDKIVWHVQAAE